MKQFNHIGRLCRVIRRHLDKLSAKEMGRKCGYRGRDRGQMIRRFETGEFILPEAKFRLYVAALNLPPAQAEALTNMYYSCLKKDADEARLDCYSFWTVKEGKCPKLVELVNQLRETSRPAMIHDELFYVHAVNTPFIRLYGYPTAYFQTPVYWHSIAVKYHPDPESPVRLAHKGFEEYFFSYEAGRFFLATSHYFFTKQMQILINFLCTLSPDVFTIHWDDLVKMRRTPRIDSAVRAFHYQGKLIKIAVATQFPTTEMEITDGHTLKYLLTWFLVQGNDADEIHQDIAENAVGPQIVFAADFVPDYNKRDWSDLL